VILPSIGHQIVAKETDKTIYVERLNNTMVKPVEIGCEKPYHFRTN
jgi:hypothetical protein